MQWMIFIRLWKRKEERKGRKKEGRGGEGGRREKG